jgi:hypothetical protein
MFTDRQRRNNTVKLGKYLANLSAAYNVQHFRMGDYLNHFKSADLWGDRASIIYADNVMKIIEECFCGTSACAVGHIPMVLKEQYKRVIKLRPEIDWIDLATMILLVEFDNARDYDDPKYGEYSFLFGGHWEDASDPYARTSWAAADRLAYSLDDKFKYSEYGMGDTMDGITGYAVKAGWVTQEQHNLHLDQAEKFDELMLTVNVVAAKHQLEEMNV